MTIAYLGQPGSFGFMAANEVFGPGGSFKGYPSHPAVFNAVADKQVDYGVMAIENVDAGLVAETIRSIVRYRYQHPASDLTICSEIMVPVNLYLMARNDTLADIQTIASHEMALLQSSKFIDDLLLKHPSLKILKVNSTSEAAKMAAADSTIAALASSMALHEFELSKLFPFSTENKANNFTRFWVIGRNPSNQTGIDKSCLILNLNRDLPGALSKSLNCFSKENINLSIVHPSPHLENNFEYLFVVEVESHIDSPSMQRSLANLAKLGAQFQLLGAYANKSTIYTSENSIYKNRVA